MYVNEGRNVYVCMCVCVYICCNLIFSDIQLCLRNHIHKLFTVALPVAFVAMHIYTYIKYIYIYMCVCLCVISASIYCNQYYKA